MNFLFKSILIINLLLVFTVKVNATVIVSEELKEHFKSDYVVNDDFDLAIKKELIFGEYGKNVIFKDACQVDDGFIVVGGSVRMGDYLGGLDGLVVKYKNNEIEWFKVFGGRNKDIFSTVYCGEDIVVGGETYINNFKSGFFVSLDKSGEVNWEKTYKEKLDLDISSVDYNGNYVFAGYINNFSTDNDFFILEINSSGEIINDKTFMFKGDDRINDILIDDFIYLVGSTDSTELGVLGQRGIILNLDEEYNMMDYDVYNSSEISLLSSIDLYDQIYVSGRIGKNEAVEVSESYGIYGTFNGTLDIKETELDVNGVIKNNEFILYGALHNKPTIISNETIVLKGSGEVVKVINESGIKAIHTDCLDVCTGIVTTINSVSKEEGNLYINGKLVPLEERYFNELNNNVFGEYRKYKYANYNGIEYYGDLTVERIELFTNINKDVYYDSVNLFFNGVGYLNEELIESGYILSEVGEHELRIAGVNEEITKTFRLENSKSGFEFYDYYIEKPIEEIKEEKKNYSIYIGGVIILIGIGFIYIKKYRNKN